MIKKLVTDGILPNPSTNMQVSAGNGMNVLVAPGFALCNGCMALEESQRTLAVQAANPNYDRIDTVVLRLNDNDSVRTCDLYVVQGVAAVKPVRPALTRTESVWEIGLADLFITPNSSIVSNQRITDTRYETERCGIISAINEFDTTTIYNQIQADMAEFKEDEQVQFVEWFEHIKGQLSEDAAGNLQLQLDDMKSVIADTYIYSNSYNPGDCVLGDGEHLNPGLYMCVVYEDANTFGSDYWKRIQVGKELQNAASKNSIADTWKMKYSYEIGDYVYGDGDYLERELYRCVAVEHENEFGYGNWEEVQIAEKLKVVDEMDAKYKVMTGNDLIALESLANIISAIPNGCIVKIFDTNSADNRTALRNLGLMPWTDASFITIEKRNDNYLTLEVNKYGTDSIIARCSIVNGTVRNWKEFSSGRELYAEKLSCLASSGEFFTLNFEQFPTANELELMITGASNTHYNPVRIGMDKFKAGRALACVINYALKDGKIDWDTSNYVKISYNNSNMGNVLIESTVGCDIRIRLLS